MMKKSIRHILQSIMATILIFSCLIMPVSAETKVDISELPNEVNEIKHLSANDFLPISSLNPEVAEKLNKVKNSFSKGVMSIANAGDQYEPNDSIVTATTGVQGKLIQATIHSETDMDFYRFEVMDNEPLSILLYNIPSGCDYDLYLFNSDQTGWYTDFQDGSLAETFYISLDSPGTYYVAVDSNSGYSNNSYSLYFGKSYVYGGTGWINPNLSFSFGSVPRGTTKTSLTKNINLTNVVSIPDGAVVEKFYLSKEGTGGDYAGFYKYLKPASGNTIQQHGAIQLMEVPANTLVKQNWEIWGSVEYSNYFTWEPRYFIQYKFFVTPYTTSFL